MLEPLISLLNAFVVILKNLITKACVQHEDEEEEYIEKSNVFIFILNRILFIV